MSLIIKPYLFMLFCSTLYNYFLIQYQLHHLFLEILKILTQSKKIHNLFFSSVSSWDLCIFVVSCCKHQPSAPKVHCYWTILPYVTFRLVPMFIAVQRLCFTARGKGVKVRVVDECVSYL